VGRRTEIPKSGLIPAAYFRREPAQHPCTASFWATEMTHSGYEMHY
jgi:hypothetical protein